MKRVEVGIRGTQEPLHPLVPFLTSDAVGSATMVDWNGVTHDGRSDESTVVLRIHGDTDAVRSAFADEPLVDRFECTVVDEDTCYVHAHSRTARLEGETATALTPPGVVVIPPVRYESNGWLSVTLVGDDPAVQRAVEEVPEEVEVTVRSVDSRGYDASSPLSELSERQRDAVVAATDRGYYDTPRSASVEDVAAALDCAPSTAAEHLRKAESRLVCTLVEQTTRG
jgi:predicted DNA binding protein